MCFRSAALLDDADAHRRLWEKLLENAEDDLDIDLARQRLTSDDSRRLSHADVDGFINALRR